MMLHYYQKDSGLRRGEFEFYLALDMSHFLPVTFTSKGFAVGPWFSSAIFFSMSDISVFLSFSKFTNGTCAPDLAEVTARPSG